MALARSVALDDKYTLDRDRIYLSGTQALARLPMVQRRRDAAAGLSTAGYVSGYRGSPLGGLDLALWQAAALTARHDIVFRPGVNEELAATAIWGTQQASAGTSGRHDGVFALWYGKGPGVDRSGDAFKHGNAAGSSRNGGVLVVAGDDHLAKSSTLPHQSDYCFIAAGIPVLVPSGIDEFVPFGVFGWALSRFSGCWVGFRAVAAIAEGSASVDAGAALAMRFAQPEVALPPGGLHIRLGDDWNLQEARLHEFKLPAALAFARANAIDRNVLDGGAAPLLGLLTGGKSFPDVIEALDLLGIDAARAGRIGLRLRKIGLAWPLEPEGVRDFADGIEEILVIEEKRPVIEAQVKERLYGRTNAPRVLGKHGPDGAALLPVTGELDPLTAAQAIGRRLAALGRADAAIAARLAEIETQLARRAEAVAPALKRTPYFCSGCPHNTSTRVPEGSEAAGGIGCHTMAVWMDRSTVGYTQMGGEGAQWVGMAPFTTTPHIFQNLGDGTYFHSGILAIRQAVAAGVNITYKLLYNDAVAMTGGQKLDGTLTVPDLVAQLRAEGVGRIVVVSDAPERHDAGRLGVDVRNRDDLDAVQRALREVPGVTAIVYEQTCASEKRRRRKRGTMTDPARRAVINEAVCEGCGDCSAKSNCLSVVPVETAFGTKRAIEQSSCNRDFSCVGGFCPSFVTIEGGSLRKPAPASAKEAGADDLPQPNLPDITGRTCNILLTGIGGTGVVTIGALLGMAAHLDGRGVVVLDQTGLAQKGGAVTTHVRIAGDPETVRGTHIPDGAADLILGCDLVVAAGAEALRLARAGRTRAIVNTHQTVTAEFTRHSTFYRFPADDLCRAIGRAVGEPGEDFFDAVALATGLLGDAIAANPLLLGYAWQSGTLPVSEEALLRAIALNGVAVELNRLAFAWGRRAAHDMASVRRAAGLDVPPPAPETLAALVERRAAFLADYQDAAYAARYRRTVARAAEVARRQAPGRTGLAEAVARNLFKLMAYKDEYEVARLLTDAAFHRRLDAMFEGRRRVVFHLAPPILARRDPSTGHLRKRAFGPWVLPAFRLLARVRRLRGTALDPFGRTAERRAERALVAEYEALVEEFASRLDGDNHACALELAALPDAIRGFGHVKAASLDGAKARRAMLLTAFRAPAAPSAAA